ncbi:MAG: DUF2252 domain-containing protein [Proteobacteria bacterium]|nr:MAG: DUF2252 domain-containing protein [Pseudomonadota bacterium]
MLESSKGRIRELVPIRYGRMMVSPFTFYRATADIMAEDLAPTPVTGLFAQLCGDCHLLNFNGYATPERRLIFDLNDFDETLPGPWEWDVKRLATSFVLAARSNGFARSDQRDAALTCVRSYREHMAEYADMGALEVWYSSVDIDAIVKNVHDKETQARMRKRIKKAAGQTVLEHDFPKMTETRGNRCVIKDNRPLIYHHPHINLAASRDNIRRAFTHYRETLEDDRKTLLDRYEMVDVSMKVVGVGSVGTFCAVALMMAADDDPLFLQIKEARASVLEQHVGRSVYPNHGERVVVGQRLMQAASDLFLGWTHGKEGRHFYIRQLHDMKLKPLVEVFNPATMVDYADLCGWTLARAHARSGDPARIAGYLGKSDVFDCAVRDFGMSYADQAEKDHAVFMKAVRSGRIEAEVEH